MAKYAIPPPLINGFELIVSVSEENFQSVISVIENSKIGEGVLPLAEKLHLQTSISDEDSKEIIRALFSMLNIYVDSKNTADKFSEDFISSYKLLYPKAELSKLDILKNRINKVLPSFKSIKQTVKAKDLLVDNANNFGEARIISDIRIIYDDDSDLKKKEQIAVLVHQLRITYADSNGNEKFFYVSLDLSDLGKLKDNINRALEKDTLIRTNHHELSFVDVK